MSSKGVIFFCMKKEAGVGVWGVREEKVLCVNVSLLFSVYVCAFLSILLAVIEPTLYLLDYLSIVCHSQ